MPTDHPELIARLRGWPNLPGLNLDKDLMRGAAAALETLAAELEAVRADAERWRWLRDPNATDLTDLEIGEMVSNLSFESLDAAVDAARAQPTSAAPTISKTLEPR